MISKVLVLKGWLLHEFSRDGDKGNCGAVLMYFLIYAE